MKDETGHAAGPSLGRPRAVRPVRVANDGSLWLIAGLSLAIGLALTGCGSLETIQSGAFSPANSLAGARAPNAMAVVDRPARRGTHAVVALSAEAIRLEAASDGAMCEIAGFVPGHERATLLESGQRWHLDLPGVHVASSTRVQSGPIGGPVRLMWISQISLDPPTARIGFMLQTGALVHLERGQDRLRVWFDKRDLQRAARSNPTMSGCRSAPLEAPPTGVSAHSARSAAGHIAGSVSIKLRKAIGRELVKELADLAGLQLHYRDRLPASAIQIDLARVSPHEALERVLTKLGYVLSEENGTWFVTHRRNPILLMAVRGTVSWGDLRRPTVREVLERLAVSGQPSAWIRRCVRRRDLDRPVSFTIDEKLSPRAVVDALLAAHGMPWKRSGQEKSYG